MNRKMAWLLVPAALATLVACAHNRYMGVDIGRGNFLVDISPVGHVTIVGYEGRTRDIRIPSYLYRMPVTGIGDGAFASGFFGSRINSVHIPNGITFIGEGAFANNRLETVHIPNSVTFIGDRAFANNRLESLIISNNVTRIGTQVFENNRLDMVIIPSSVTYIGARAFARNQFESKPSMPNVVWIRDSAFARNRHRLEMERPYVIGVGGPVVPGDEYVVEYARGSNVITIKGTRPDPGGLYVVQVGAFEEIADAWYSFDKLLSAGFSPLLERSDGMYMVFIANIVGATITEVAQQLAFAGFSEASIRREN
ncbi:MAG: leucine-rich repeat protein [Treponema sp.]|nr:leucine-rich repeat protein [Treponema sp.]